MKRRLFGRPLLAVAVLGSACCSDSSEPLYKDVSQPVERRIDDLMGRMTLREKIAQMRHIHFKHFDNEGEVDLEKLASSTGGVGWGCVEAFPYSSGTIHEDHAADPGVHAQRHPPYTYCNCW